MVQKILIFKIFFLIFLLNSSSLYAEIIVGKAKIIDGDTIYINKNKIRLHGIDAPEINQPCILENKKWLCGKDSANELVKITNNQIINCNIISTDKYKRYIAICYANKININQIMVRKGWAIAYRYYSKDYVKDEEYARKNKSGIWKSKFEEPYIFRKKK